MQYEITLNSQSPRFYTVDQVDGEIYGSIGKMKLLSKNQLVGTSPGYAIIRDLYEDEDGKRISVPKSASFEVIKADRELSNEQLIAKYPVKPRI